MVLDTHYLDYLGYLDR